MIVPLRALLGTAAGVVWVASGVLAIVYQGEHEPGTAVDYVVEGTFAVGVALTAFLLMAVHAAQQQAAGRLGQIGIVTFLAAASIQVVATVIALAGIRQVDVVVLPALLLILVALVVYGVSTWRARAFPRWVAGGMIVGLPVAVALGLFGGNILFGAFWIAVGFAPTRVRPNRRDQ